MVILQSFMMKTVLRTFIYKRGKKRHRKPSKFCKPTILIWWVLLSIHWEKLILKTIINKTKQNKHSFRTEMEFPFMPDVWGMYSLPREKQTQEFPSRYHYLILHWISIHPKKDVFLITLKIQSDLFLLGLQ